MRIASKSDQIRSVRYVPPDLLDLEFGDNRIFPLPILDLEMPIDQISWSTVRASIDGTALLMDHVSGGTVPIDAAAIRCMVDESYAANAGGVMDVLQMTREVREPIWSGCPALRVDGAVVRVGSTRVSLDTVVEANESGMTPEAIVEEYDSLALTDVQAALAFYRQNSEAVRAYLERRQMEAEALQTRIEAERPPVSRKELLARRNARGKANAAARQ